MKTKKLFSILLTLSLTIVPAQTENTKKAQEQTAKISNDLEKYFQQQYIAPSQVSIISIKHYFQNFMRSPINTTNKLEIKTFKKAQQEKLNQTKINFIKEVYNEKGYAKKLSQDGSDIIDALKVSSGLKLNAEYDYTWLRLFHNKAKECEMVDDTVLLQLLESLPTLLERHFSEEKEYNAPSFNFLKESIEKTLIFKFTDHLTDFQNDPNTFMSDMSAQIAKQFRQEVKKAEKTFTKQENQWRLRQVTIKLLEVLANKTVWDHSAYEGVWPSVISCANGFQLLGSHGILDHMDDLDDLQWSLTHRFKYFIKQVGSQMPMAFYEEIENDLTSRIVFFLETQEQDTGVKSKKEVLMETLQKAKAKAVAFERNGLFTDQIL